jgi:hypothetical protein
MFRFSRPRHGNMMESFMTKRRRKSSLSQPTRTDLSGLGLRKCNNRRLATQLNWSSTCQAIYNSTAYERTLLPRLLCTKTSQSRMFGRLFPIQSDFKPSASQANPAATSAIRSYPMRSVMCLQGRTIRSSLAITSINRGFCLNGLRKEKPHLNRKI